MKQLSRKPFMLMLKDDSGEVKPVPLDLSHVNSDNALIVLDEYNDTCWVWVGRGVSMPTRMHTLRMGRGIQKSGYKVGVTTIGLASGKIVEMMEKDDTDSEVASAILAFKDVLNATWSFDDKVLAFKKVKIQPDEPIAGAPTKKYVPEPEPEPSIVAETIREAPARPVAPPASPTSAVTPAMTLAEKKAAYLMMSIMKHAEIVYTEKIQKAGSEGFKIEVPGVLVIEAMMQGNDLSISPGDFGGSETAQKIKSEFLNHVKTV